MAMVYLLFVIGFLLLVYGANWLVDGAASIAKRHNISNVVIGMTVVALGTSAPELVVNLVASFKNTADVALGNILGSNIANIFLILGVSALIFPVAVNRNTFSKEVPFAIAGALLFGILANDLFLVKSDQLTVSRMNGIVLMAFFGLFMVYAYGISRTKGTSDNAVIKKIPFWKSLFMVIAGLVALVAGGRWIVDGAVEIAALFGMSESVISLTIVALGTSLPELATCIAAALKRNADIVIGNVLGSNIFNIFFVMGTSAFIKPLPFNQVLNFDVVVGIISILLLWVFLIMSGQRILLRWHGGVFVVMYVAYIAFLVS
jgi:cation:H+ antiporter